MIGLVTDFKVNFLSTLEFRGVCSYTLAKLMQRKQ